ncbi:hypothetical protein [Citrobacter freundii]|uniref:hypothetical protein n=1 Tax=Citrobacter freundii TaxID=546 RepID=UPI003996A8A7
MTALNKQALEHLTRKLTRRLNDAYGFSRTSKGKHTTITLSIGECRELIYAIESAEKRAEAAEKRIAELSASHSKLRDTMATIHNTIRMDGGYTPLAAILNAAKRAYEESATAAGIGVKVE